MFFKDSLKVFLVLVLAFQLSMQVFAQDRAYNEEASRILAISVNNKFDAITFVRDFNADPNAVDENGDTILIKALHGELADGEIIDGKLAKVTSLGFPPFLGIPLLITILVSFGYYLDDIVRMIGRSEAERIDLLFAEWEASGASQVDLEFWRTLLDRASRPAMPNEIEALVRQARAINEIDKELVPDELLAIIEEYAN